VPLSAAWVAVHHVDISRGEGSSGIAGTHATPYQCLRGSGDWNWSLGAPVK